ncbi:MAG: YicC family protein [Ignavibacteriaceae bacterium]|nr:YicC family protein [Ignavibacteriaceae bacterium]
MISSMTGFGKGIAGKGNLSVDVEIKSINSRYLEISLRLPNSILAKEYEIREIIRQKFTRGKLNVSISIKRNGASADIPVLDSDKLKAYASLLKQVKKQAKLSDKIKLEHFLSIRDIFTVNNTEYSEEEFELVKEALASAMDDLINMKNLEGSELSKDLINRIHTIETCLKSIEQNIQESVKEHFELLRARINQLLNDVEINKDRLDTELALLADKSDITEECVRLNSHIKFFKETLESGSDSGRKLNFLCQEMNREANTISSKTVSTFISHQSVLIKEEIEKIREQIQNIE